MPAQTEARSDLDAHEADSVETVARLHQAHDKKASRTQRVIDGVTDTLGRPTVTVCAMAAIALWAAFASLQSAGRMNGPMAMWLELLATIAALFLALVILASQRRSDQFAARRAALTLDLALLADQKNAKIIALLQQLRRDTPGMAGQDDPETDQMATPLDAGAALEAIDASVRRGQ